ncbi:hypothetical protein [Mycobacteroides abscessus]|uniref:hypothetical protein n=1 Tax=Mycobacteroides abscessus TaxID=36809 RepID=UPI001300096D|nr:hypothetical protein [Mycobacteroides abscessus]
MASSSVLIPDWFGALGIESVETWDPREAWERTERDINLRVPLGIVSSAGEVSSEIVDPDQVLWLDCSDCWAGGDGAHGAIQGPQADGGVNLNAVVALGVCARFSPRRMNLVLVDLGDTGQFDELAGLPHVRGYFRGGDPARVLREFHEYARSEVGKRRAGFQSAGMKDYIHWLNSGSCPEFPGLLVFVNSPGDTSKVADFSPLQFAAASRALGMHVCLSFEHYPQPESADVLGPDWSFPGFMESATYRIAFRCETGLLSRGMLFAEDASDIPEGSGEAIFNCPNRMGPVPRWIRFQPFNVIGPSRQGSVAASLIDKIKAVSA